LNHCCFILALEKDKVKSADNSTILKRYLRRLSIRRGKKFFLFKSFVIFFGLGIGFLGVVVTKEKTNSLFLLQQSPNGINYLFLTKLIL